MKKTPFPQSCKSLFDAIEDAVLQLPVAPISIAVKMIEDDFATALALRDHLKASRSHRSQIAHGVLVALQSIISQKLARDVGRDVLNEIEAVEDKK